MNNSILKKWGGRALMSCSKVLLLVGCLAPQFALSSSAVPVADNQQAPSSLAPMLDKVLPTVVSIEVEGVQLERQKLPEELRFFFGPNFPTEQLNRRPFIGKGSGVVIDAEKHYIVTNNHVINNSDKIRVLLNDGRQYEAKLVGADEISDVALLQLVNARNLKAITMTDSDKIRVGDYAVAVGNPFGIGQTATSGIISAIGRTDISNADLVGNFIQTDAAINSGNSGGALVNLKGELIGMNTAILAPNGGNIGIGFAIPSNMVKNFVEQMVRFGEVRRGVLGIKGQNLEGDVATALHLSEQKGALVSEVLPNSPADRAGIKAGDIIVSVDGSPLRSFSDLRAKIASTYVDKVLKLGLLRDGKPKSVEVRLQVEKQQSQVKLENLHAAFQGVKMNDSELKGIHGVEIIQIDPRSPALRFGLKEGDLIVSVNRERVTDMNKLRSVLSSKPAVLALNIQRGSSSLYLVIR